jgi:protocatechuate 3,4-dioxygenase beta subunit
MTEYRFKKVDPVKRFIYFISCFAWLLAACATPSANQNSQLALNQTPAANEPRFTPPPGVETPEVKKLIDKAEASFNIGATTASSLLTNLEYMPAHEWPRFRQLIRAHAMANQLTVVTAQEPGDPLVVTGTIRDKQGAPLKGGLIYIYQTSAKGWYSDKAPHISGNSGDQKHARLFGYLNTNQNGQYEFRTIRPAGYPNSNLPAHIHIEIAVAGNEPHTFISEILFADDARLTSDVRERSLREGLVIFPVTRTTNREWRVQADFQTNQAPRAPA